MVVTRKAVRYVKRPQIGVLSLPSTAVAPTAVPAHTSMLADPDRIERQTEHVVNFYGRLRVSLQRPV